MYEHFIQGDAAVSYYSADMIYGVYNKRGSAFTDAPNSAGDYVAEITLGSGDNTATASVGYTISKKVPTAVPPTGLTAIYGQTLGMWS